MKQLDRLLFLQGGRCFYCDDQIPSDEASIEHLVAASLGGSNGDDNCVVCCRALNAMFGNRSYKEKLHALLSHRGKFTCPDSVPARASVTSSGTPNGSLSTRLDAVVKDLRARKTARPRKVATLKNTIASVFKKQIADPDVDVLLRNLVDAGFVKLEGTKVGYTTLLTAPE